MWKGKITTYICTKCGELLFRVKAGAECSNCSSGEIKSYHVFDALALRMLNRAGYKVLDYTFSKGADQDREIRVKFADTYDFTRYEPPEGFVYGSVKVPADQIDEGRNVALLYKRYEDNMPKFLYALQLAIDKIDVMLWSFTLPIPKSLPRK